MTPEDVRIANEFRTLIHNMWGEVVSPLVERYLTVCGQDGYFPSESDPVDGFRQFLDTADPESEVESFGVESAGRVLFSVEPDRTLTNRGGFHTPVKDMWDGWVAYIRETHTDPDWEGIDPDTASVSDILWEFAGYASDQLHDDYEDSGRGHIDDAPATGWDAEGVPTGD
jgi:hypothetical protein